ncbi:MAG: ribosomal protein S18-alanine N-acetyltransferase [Corallococcus sp.]|nr:ribosomal protein S18-alanine N-acetyltransferase [Corallococcus sp.]
MIKRLTYSPSNVEILAEIERQCFGKEAWSKESLDSELANTYSVFWAYIESSDAVGYVSARDMAGEVQICNVAVLPRYRRRGYARALLNEVIEFARQRNAVTVELEVNTQNTAAVNLYGSAGFSAVGLRRNFYPQSDIGKDAYTMTLDIG